MEKLKNNLKLLFASKILDYQFDMLSNKISFLLETLDNGNTHTYKLMFNKVSVCYFVNNTTTSRMNVFEPDEGDYLEFTSINIIDKVQLSIDLQK